MNTEITISENLELSIWEDNNRIEEVRKLFAPNLSDTEFKIFMGLGKSCKLNPFTREIWAVKYQSSTPAQIFIGRDGYRKAAQSHADYDFHQCDAVYENDEFEVNNGEVHHKYKLTNRGTLIGAYCIVKRRKSSKPIYVFAELKEYSTNKSLWNSVTGKPATMIKKVAESQCLRACFQDLLGGTYGEEEFSNTKENYKSNVVYDDTSNTNKLKQMLNIGDKKNEIIDVEECSAQLSEEQLKRIENLFISKNFDESRIRKALAHYEVEDLSELDNNKAQNFISLLERAKC